MRSVLRLIDAYRQRGGDRIRRLRLEAERQPEGCAMYVLAIALWEEDELEEAHRLATPLLQDSPDDFNLLAISLAFHMRVDDAAQMDHFARRLAVAENPAHLERRANAIANLLLSPLRLFGYGRISGKYQDVLDQWADWARTYVEAHPVPDPLPSHDR